MDLTGRVSTAAELLYLRLWALAGPDLTVDGYSVEEIGGLIGKSRRSGFVYLDELERAGALTRARRQGNARLIVLTLTAA